ncbi:G-type lectin S-receptor serine/threonine-protein kinase [Salix suchowensis]|nr:G-type lectin S-receptor serine/threonine-protein kinase [Salix suchowensis]
MEKPFRSIFSAGIDPSSIPEIVVWNGSRPIWRSGPWNGQIFIGVPIMSSTYLDGFSLADDRNGGFTLSFGFSDDSFITNFVLSSEGKFGQVYLDDTTEGSWGYEWENDQDECEFYGKCGSFASCDAMNSPICSCLKGFEPKNSDEWNSRNWTNGCVRRTATLCETTQNDGQVPKKDGFSKLERVKALKLWNQGNISALVDPGISYPSFHEEIFRCVDVGLLCVQEFARDRPAIFTVISMLKSEIVDLPTPKQPAFSERRSELDTESFQHDSRPESINNVTVTLLSGR